LPLQRDVVANPYLMAETELRAVKKEIANLRAKLALEARQAELDRQIKP
jgi:hypothetical protein